MLIQSTFHPKPALKSLRIKVNSLVLFFFLVSYPIQDMHGPHQGRMQPAESYKIESLGCTDHLEVYLYDKDSQSESNIGLSGDITFYYPNEKKMISPLDNYGRDGFSAKIANNGYSYYVIRILIKDKYISARFESECAKTAEIHLSH
jgi:hypothetical protein